MYIIYQQINSHYNSYSIGVSILILALYYVINIIVIIMYHSMINKVLSYLIICPVKHFHISLDVH